MEKNLIAVEIEDNHFNLRLEWDRLLKVGASVCSCWVSAFRHHIDYIHEIITSSRERAMSENKSIE